MANSPAHKLGQIIGEELESAIREPLKAIAKEYNLYLDYEHARPARRGKKKVTWADSYGNTHDLDYVLEKGGSEDIKGCPKAFIEIAWRRYTKHSKNKAQEIQCAVSPLAEAHHKHHPFLGIVLAGDFTDNSLEQLRSHGFSLVYCPYKTIKQAFATQKMDISWEENTSRNELQKRVKSANQLTSDQREKIARKIRSLHSDQFDQFFKALRCCLDRRIECIFILILSGTSHKFDCVADAISFVTQHNDQSTSMSDFIRYELNIRYTNADEIRAKFQKKDEAIKYLRLLEIE